MKKCQIYTFWIKLNIEKETAASNKEDSTKGLKKKQSTKHLQVTRLRPENV